MDEDPRQALVVRWLTIMWLAAVGVCLCDYWSVDNSSYRRTVDWGPIFLGIGIATGIYAVLAWLAAFAWHSTGRVIVLLAAWAYNLVQYLLIVVVAYCAVHIAFRCIAAPKVRPGST